MGQIPHEARELEPTTEPVPGAQLLTQPSPSCKEYLPAKQRPQDAKELDEGFSPVPAAQGRQPDPEPSEYFPAGHAPHVC